MEEIRELCRQKTFMDYHNKIVNTCLDSFVNYINKYDSLESQKDKEIILSNTVKWLEILYKTKKFVDEDANGKLQLILVLLFSDVGKVIKTKNGTDFSNNGVVSACCFWSLVQNLDNNDFFRPIFLTIWFQYINSSFNNSLKLFLNDNVVEMINCLNYVKRQKCETQINQDLILPNLPIAVYVCGKSGIGKTTLARNAINQLNDISCGYCSLEKTILGTVGGISDEWSDCDVNIRGKIYKDVFNKYKENKYLVKKVNNKLKWNFVGSTKNNDVTFITSTVLKPKPHLLPFFNLQNINLLTVPERKDYTIDYFENLNIKMQAEMEEAGWASKGPLLFVPEKELDSCIKYILKNRKFKLEPPIVTRPKELIFWIDYWKKVTGSIECMKNAVRSFYDIFVSTCETKKGTYLNFYYKDGAPYDDPVVDTKGTPSPANFCRGTTFFYENENDTFKLVRLPMNRGKEIMFTSTDVDDLLEDGDIQTKFYSDMVKKSLNEQHLFTAKVDGSLLIAFIDKFDLIQNERLSNRKNIVFGTKGMVTITNEETINTFCNSLEYSGYTVESFSELCYEFMVTRNLYSLSFEMVAEKRKELVVDYPVDYKGVYFLGGSHDDIFEPYFKLSNFINSPITKTMSIQDASNMILGPFPEHMEGSVIWVNNDGLYYPLKLKTMLYYIMHKPRNREEYLNYLLQLIDQYGWITPNPPTSKDLNPQKIIFSLFGLVNLPKETINVIPFLRNVRHEYEKMDSIKIEEVMNSSNKNEICDWHRFKNIYGSDLYSKSYELASW